jgi:hypothetical protein
VSAAEESFPAASATGTPGDEVAEDKVAETEVEEAGPAGARVTFGGTAAADFLSSAVVGSVAVVVDWADWEKSPGLALSARSVVVAVIAPGDWAIGLEFGVRLEVTDGALLLAPLLARLSTVASPVFGALSDCAAAVVASTERAGAGAVSRKAEPRLGAGCAAAGLIAAGLIGVELAGLKLSDVELLSLASVELGSAGGFAFAGSVTSVVAAMADWATAPGLALSATSVVVAAIAAGA